MESRILERKRERAAVCAGKIDQLDFVLAFLAFLVDPCRRHPEVYRHGVVGRFERNGVGPVDAVDRVYAEQAEVEDVIGLVAAQRVVVLRAADTREVRYCIVSLQQAQGGIYRADQGAEAAEAESKDALCAGKIPGDAGQRSEYRDGDLRDQLVIAGRVPAGGDTGISLTSVVVAAVAVAALAFTSDCADTEICEKLPAAVKLMT